MPKESAKKATERRKEPKPKTAAPARAPQVAPKADQKQQKKGGPTKYIAAIVIIVIIIGVAIFAAGLINSGPGTQFQTFKNNFNSAPRVAIFVTAYNGTILSSTVGCATAVIEQIVGSKTNHRNSSTIDFNVLNQTLCIRTNGLSGNVTKYTNTSVQNCLNLTKTEPTIYINYSSTNTTVVKPTYLGISGTVTFLKQCGIASQLS